jgi:hypothetical protein
MMELKQKILVVDGEPSIRKLLRTLLEIDGYQVDTVSSGKEQSLQMAFIQRNDLTQQISSAAFDPTLRYTILPRAFEGRSYWAHLQGSNGHRNLEPELRFAVKDKKPRSRLKRKRFSQLLGCTCTSTRLHKSWPISVV